MTVLNERAAVAPEVEESLATMTAEPAPVVDKGLIAQLVGDARAAGTAIDGEGGLLSQLTKLVVEAALDGEMTAHLGYQKHERAGDEDSTNARNGAGPKTVLTKAGPLEIDVPRDRVGIHRPQIRRAHSPILS